MKKQRILCILLAVVIAIISCTSISFAAPKEQYFGKTSNGKKVYYKVYDVKVHDIKKYASKPTKNQWDKFAKGALDVSLSFANWKVGLSYAAICTLLGLGKGDNVSISYGTRFFDQAQMHSIKERRFYIYTNASKTNKRIVYKDQYGKADINNYIDPVGKGLKITCLKSKRNVTLKTKYYDNKSYILKRCGVHWSHKSTEVWNLDSEVLYQTFK